MNTSITHENVNRFDALNYVATDVEKRDAEQSHRLHEPTQMITTIDPISGRDIQDLSGRPHIVDGNIVIYFETEENRQAYIDMPMDHPVKLPDNPYEDGEAEG